MAGPAFVRGRFDWGSGTSKSVTNPTVDSAGGILIVLIAVANTSSHSCSTSGWTKVDEMSISGVTLSVWIALESAGAPTITWTGSVAFTCETGYYKDAAGSMTATFGTVSKASGAGGATMSALTTTRNDSLMYAALASSDSSLAPTTPSGWTNRANGSVSTPYIRLVDKAITTSGTSTGSVATTAVGANVVAIMFEIEGTPAPTSTWVPKIITI